MPRYYAPLWYRLYQPTELTTDLYSRKVKQWIKKKKGRSSKTNEEENVSGKVVVITGANSGIGKHTAIAMAKRGAVVVMGCRDMGKGEEARKEIVEESQHYGVVELYQLDLSDLESVREFGAQVLKNHSVIDILINNAGITLNNRVQQKTKEGWDLCMVTNHLGHFLLTNLLLEAILASDIARVVTVSSSACTFSTMDTSDLLMERLDDLGFMNTKPYQNSKLANLFFAKTLAQKYPKIKSYSMCPGMVETEVFRHYEMTRTVIMIGRFMQALHMQKVEFAVDFVMRLAVSRKVDGDSGGFFRFGKRVKQVEKMLKDKLANEVWSESEKIAGVNF